ncbi:NAD(P)/FAD-dependent oxidoreductase [Pengzhenrongella sp.]|jgi:thioredoxin reductase (NADPH)|uniref:NAD(P)/FAD-dependent oxidoreductase n=1 Tax=Pengzhenrongella sp. TaxID=2888820 RepID=UPI002F95BEB2
MSAPEIVPLLIVGGGPAGYTAALYAGRAGLTPICIEGFDSGGQLSRSFLVENFPGVPDGTSGADLSNRIREQAIGFGARVVMDDVVGVDLSRRPFRVVTTSHSYLADAIVVATGSVPRPLGLPREEELIGRGIAYCALCDGAFFAGQEVIVVGGGNAALGESIQMARVASRVTLVHRRSEFRADDVVEVAARAIAGIEILTPHVVEELLADDDGNLCGVRLRNLSTGERCVRETAGLFVAIGHEPATGLFAPYLAISRGHIVTSLTSTETSLEGVFAAGDVADSRYRQAVTAAASGCQAAIDAERWLVTGDWVGASVEPAVPVAARRRGPSVSLLIPEQAAEHSPMTDPVHDPAHDRTSSHP